jgi:hypothetical protein
MTDGVIAMTTDEATMIDGKCSTAQSAQVRPSMLCVLDNRDRSRDRDRDYGRR